MIGTGRGGRRRGELLVYIITNVYIGFTGPSVREAAGHNRDDTVIIIIITGAVGISVHNRKKILLARLYALYTYIYTNTMYVLKDC